MKPKVFIAYCSPSKSTRHVAEVIEATITESSGSVEVLDLEQQDRYGEFKKQLKEAGANGCLFIGAPVYRDMVAPPMMAFIESLPVVEGCHAVPFVTWGGAFSGIALWQMGQALIRKGFDLAGGAKILGVHSMMWSHASPVGQGRPNIEDEQVVSEFTREIFKRLTENQIQTLALEVLDYNDDGLTKELKDRLGQPWMIIPKTVDEEKCTQCGVCEEVCPVGAVKLVDTPMFSKDCFDCFNCIRLCPEEAIESGVPLEKIQGMILDRVVKFNETPHTEIFLP